MATLLVDCNSFDEISCVAGAVSLSELALDGNPMSHELSYKQTVLRHVTQIRQLDMKRVTVRTYLCCFVLIYALYRVLSPKDLPTSLILSKNLIFIIDFGARMEKEKI